MKIVRFAAAPDGGSQFVGKKHRCSNGEVFLADDAGSRGHRTRTIGGPARVLFVHLPPDANLGV